MKKIFTLLITLLLLLTACAPNHDVAVQVDMDDAFSGTLKIDMSLKAKDLLIDSPSEGDVQAGLADVKTVIDEIIANGDNFNSKDLKVSLDDESLSYSYEESFTDLESFEAIVSRISGESYVVEVKSYGSPLSGNQYYDGLYVDSNFLLSWIYDAIESNQSFGENSSKARLYINDKSTLTIDGEAYSKWSTYTVENSIALKSVFLDIYLQNDSTFDSKLTITASKDELSEDDAKMLVKQFENATSNSDLMEGESFNIEFSTIDKETTITLATEGIVGYEFTDLVDELVDISPQIKYRTSDDNKTANLITSTFESLSDVYKNTDEIDVRIHLNDYSISEVNGLKYTNKIHHSFDIDDNILSSIANDTEFTLTKKSSSNILLIVVATIAALFALVLVFFGIKKVNKGNKDRNAADDAKKVDYRTKEEMVTEIPAESKDEPMVELEQATETEPQNADTEETLDAADDAIESETVSQDTDSVETARSEPNSFFNGLLLSVKNKNTWIKAGVFILLTLVMGVLMILMSGSSLDPFIDLLNGTDFMLFVIVALGSGSASGTRIFAANGGFNAEIVLGLPLILVFILSYGLTNLFANKVLKENHENLLSTFTSKLSMSAIVLIVLLVVSFIKFPVGSDATASLSPIGVILYTLPLHLIAGFVSTYKTVFGQWPFKIDSEMMAYITKKMFYISGLALILTVYTFFKMGIEMLPLIVNVFVYSNFVVYGGSVTTSFGLGSLSSSLGSIITDKFSIILFLVMFASVVFLVFDIDKLFKKSKVNNPLQFAAVFAGVFTLIQTVMAFLSSLYLNTGIFGTLKIGVNPISIVVMFIIIAVLVYIRTTVLSGVDLKEKALDVSKNFVEKTKDIADSIGTDKETPLEEVSETPVAESIVEQADVSEEHADSAEEASSEELSEIHTPESVDKTVEDNVQLDENTEEHVERDL